MILTRETMKGAPRPVGKIVESSIPARLDALPWSHFHTLVIVALGITWVLDGLEVTLAGAVSGALKASPALHLSDAEVGATASAYLAGAALGVYIAATAASALAPDFAMFALFRFITGAGIGGEYTAINSALQELIPVHYRGRTDLAINGSFWLGALAGALGTTVLLEPGRFPPDIGWRLAFGIGAALGLGILFVRRVLPESPRWLLVHGRPQEAESIVAAIERSIRGSAIPREAPCRLRFSVRTKAIGFVDLGVS